MDNIRQASRQSSPAPVLSFTNSLFKDGSPDEDIKSSNSSQASFFSFPITSPQISSPGDQTEANHSTPTLGLSFTNSLFRDNGLHENTKPSHSSQAPAFSFSSTIPQAGGPGNQSEASPSSPVPVFSFTSGLSGDQGLGHQTGFSFGISPSTHSSASRGTGTTHPPAQSSTGSMPPPLSIPVLPTPSRSPEPHEQTGTGHATGAPPPLHLETPTLPRPEAPPSPVSSDDEDEATLLARHLEWLKPTVRSALGELESAPLFTRPVLRHAREMHKSGGHGHTTDKPFSQHGLLGSCGDISINPSSGDPRLFYNVSAPSSAFICGSQGSGKSHTLSCMLENCLIKTQVSDLPRPLTGLLFHYDTFVSDISTAPCEAAYLSSHPDVKVRVLCPPTNLQTMKRTYARLPNVQVKELRLNESDLNTKRMKDLMAVGSGTMPLYMHVVQRILRDLRLEQQQNSTPFSYSDFRHRIMKEDWRPEQLAPLQQRLDTLESFLAKKPTPVGGVFKIPVLPSTSWTPEAGQLTIVDLSCPCVTPEMACSLFNICLSVFLEQGAAIGRVVALDEAHKYMGDSAECDTLTNTLLATIRLQRHLGTRVIISTQEPSISPKLLDLCSMTVVHRFTSPDWMRVLRSHLAGTATMAKLAQYIERRDGEEEAADEKLSGLKGLESNGDSTFELFSQIVELKTGEALVFAPNAVVNLKQGKAGTTPKRLAHNVLRVTVRRRVTKDGGESIMAS
ncbi:hypothetical protein F5Y14DRAFT_400866 [Nemania sp. NC0429]|nr:hypothetical protein F5Y14DRAFT_400866 [Nemania sp. NC0429]